MQLVNLKQITTERRNERTMNIDTLSTIEMLKALNHEDKTVPLAVEKALPQVSVVVDKLYDVLYNGGRLIYMGAGTSGRIAILDASECPPTYGTDPDMVIALIAGGDQAMTVAIEGAEDDEDSAIEDLKRINLTSNDFVIGLSASGRTPYVVSGVNYAKSIGAQTACITTSENSILAKSVDYPIEAITGAEPITGSTRMKSGTAQKLICNMITTATMIKLGKVYENLMIDVQPTNQKLVSRARHIIYEITGVSFEEAGDYLERFQSVKKAIFAILTGVEDHQQVEHYLELEKGHLRNALNRFNKDHQIN